MELTGQQLRRTCLLLRVLFGADGVEISAIPRTRKRRRRILPLESADVRRMREQLQERLCIFCLGEGRNKLRLLVDWTQGGPNV
jgi:hypothetical protein